jgi:hypothetical protein
MVMVSGSVMTCDFRVGSATRKLFIGSRGDAAGGSDFFIRDTTVSDEAV